MNNESVTLRISNSDAPLVRAGANLMVLPIILLALIMLGFTKELPTNGKLLFGAFLVVTILVGCRLFFKTVARITFDDDRIDVLLAMTNKTHQYSDIELVKLVRFRLTPLLRMQIKLRGHLLKQQYEIPGPATEWGTLSESSRKLREQFERRGVKVTE